MKKFSLPVFTDAFLISAISFFIFVILLTPLNVSALIKFLIAFLISLGVSFLIITVKVKKQNALFLKTEDDRIYKKLMHTLEIMPDNEAIDLLIKVFNKFNTPITKGKKSLKGNNFICFFNFDYSTSRQTLASFLKKAYKKNIIIFCNKLSDECNELTTIYPKKICVINGKRLFLILKEKDLLPEELMKENQGIKLKQKILNALNKLLTKKRARNLTLLGLSLLAFSYFTFYPRYYRIYSLILLIFALICLIFGKKEQNSDSFKDIIDD
ncbi:MAG: hypothetical protein IJW13_01515 [Clostridia bacterium]|nr:hypothetical protein [Clostridia bacterium]